MTQPNKMLTMLQTLAFIRLWERQNIPLLTPLISLDILVLAASAKLQGKELAAKTFHLTLGYSEDRTREIIQHLEIDGWLRSSWSQEDKRMKIVTATEKLMRVMEGYCELLSGLRHPTDRKQPVLPAEIQQAFDHG